MVDPASLARSISEAVSRTISETVNATLAQVGMQPEIQQWWIWGRGLGSPDPCPPTPLDPPLLNFRLHTYLS